MIKVVSPFLMILFSTSAYSSDKWVGSLEGFSRACETRDIILKENSISWFDCKDVKFKKIDENESKLTLQIDEAAQCERAGQFVQFIIEKKYGQLQTEVKSFKSSGNLGVGDFNLMCIYDIPRPIQ